jgi:transcription-repair coupling factor (superfamily II helicase)
LDREEALDAFSDRLADRFGPLPEQTRQLVDLMRLRLQGARLGMEKMVWRKGRFRAHLPDGHRQDYYQGAVFGAILQTVQQFPDEWVLRQQGSIVQLVYQRHVTVISLYQMLQKIS